VYVRIRATAVFDSFVRPKSKNFPFIYWHSAYSRARPRDVPLLTKANGQPTVIIIVYVHRLVVGFQQTPHQAAWRRASHDFMLLLLRSLRRRRRRLTLVYIPLNSLATATAKRSPPLPTSAPVQFSLPEDGRISADPRPSFGLSTRGTAVIRSALVCQCIFQRKPPPVAHHAARRAAWGARPPASTRAVVRSSLV
jgi:hypothetical protein